MNNKKIYYLLTIITSALVLYASCVKTTTSKDVTPANVYNPSIIIGSDSYAIIALDPLTGNQNWTYGVYGTIIASPIVYNEKVYFGATNGDTIYKLDSRTGQLQNKFCISKGNVWGIQATPIASGYMLYVAGMSDTLYAIDTGTGKVYWTFAADGPLVSSPTIYNNNIYFASMNGTVYSINHLTGALVWSYPMGVGHPFMSSPAVAYPYVYLGSLDGYFYSFDMNPTTAPVGSVKYAYYTTKPIHSSPTEIAGRVLFGGDNDTLYCLDTATFIPDWVFRANGFIKSSPYYSVNQQVVYVADYNNDLFCLNIKNGGIRWTFHTTGINQSSPLVYGPYVYIASFDKNIYAVDTAYGTMKWYHNINGIVEFCSPTIDNLSGTQQYNSSISGYTQ